MTAADLPTVTGIPNNGGEGSRFLGYPVYDAVMNWDFQHTNETADVTPGLFSAWKIVMQQNLKTVGIEIDFDVVEWGAMLVAFRSAADAPASHGVDVAVHRWTL